MKFSEAFLSLLIHAALVWTALGALTLVWLFRRDRKNKKIW